MNTLQVSISQKNLVADSDHPLTVPVAIPSLEDVLQFAKALHAVGQAWEGIAFGWPADYTPEIQEEDVVFEEYDEHGASKMVVETRWTPAMFCAGINGIWFVSLNWEFGSNRQPWIYLEGDYGYQFDEGPQLELLKSRTRNS